MNEKANDFLGGSSAGELFEHDEHSRFDRPAFIIIRGPSDDDEPIVITLPEVLAEALAESEGAQ